MSKCYISKRRIPIHRRDKVAFYYVKCMRFFADAFFRNRYGHRAVVLETIAAIPGMVGGMLIHLRCLRKIKDDEGWIRQLLEEAENERMHLMTFIHIAQPNMMERLVIIIAQLFFIIFYFILYIFSPYTAHRTVGYLEEEAVTSYSQYLEEVIEGRIPNVNAPSIAQSYWGLANNSTLLDLIKVIRDDECRHRDKNHGFADAL
ncbi:MAG TPA: alternative oxidase [Alphaproteobacteria bacterium]|nr:alternative oxidase [Alphaproteobacteria bacterium]